MVKLPDGAILKMLWTQVQYINHNDNIIFPIIPMVNDRDIIIFPNMQKWMAIEQIFSLKEREEIIFLLEHIKWKRNVKVVETGIEAKVNSPNLSETSTLEGTKGYKQLSEQNLFDPDSMLDKQQVKTIYLAFEKKFANHTSGIVFVPQELLIDGSVLKECSIPILKANRNVDLRVFSF